VGVNANTLTPEQINNARFIAGVASAKGLRFEYAAVGIAVAKQESNLINVSYGDRDSLGLFQQRPSQGWGTPQQIMNRAYSTNTFFDHLLQVSDRAQLSPIALAEAVQRPDPQAYALTFGENYRIAVALLRGRYHTTNGGNTPEQIALDTGCAAGGASNAAVEVAVQVALSQIGIPYHYGGCSRSVGFDCSCLVQYAFGKAGIKLPRTADEQYGVGEPVKLQQLQRGDLVFWANSSGFVEHVAIYLGGGQIVVARHTGTFIQTQQLWLAQGGLHFVGGRRIASGKIKVPKLGWGLPLPRGAATNSYSVDGKEVFATAQGTPVFAASDGVIQAIRSDPLRGIYMIIRHPHGVVTEYDHLLGHLPDLKPGDTVQAGEQINAVGATGSGSGARLQFSVKVNGKYVDPVQFLRSKGVRP
jgi:cell wall-associated NlpC family hydrolase